MDEHHESVESLKEWAERQEDPEDAIRAVWQALRTPVSYLSTIGYKANATIESARTVYTSCGYNPGLIVELATESAKE